MKGIAMLQPNTVALTRWLSLVVATLILAACDPLAPTSENPLDGPAIADDGSGLLGAWHGELNGYEAFVHVVNGTGHNGALETLVVGHPDRKSGGAWGALSAIPANIDGTGYLSIKVLTDQGNDVRDPAEQGYHLVRYRAGRGYVTLYAMDQSLIDSAIRSHQIEGDVKSMRLEASSHDLVRLIEKVGGQDLFSVQIGYLEKVPEDDLPAVR
jgi:hypothetical protein